MPDQEAHRPDVDRRITEHVELLKGIPDESQWPERVPLHRGDRLHAERLAREWHAARSTGVSPASDR